MIRTISICVVAASLSLSGCTQFQVSNSRMLQADAYRTVSVENITSAEAAYEALKAIKEAKQSGLDFYSPLHIKEAERYLGKAQSLSRLHTNKRSEVASATSALMAIKVLEEAEANKGRLLSTLPEVFKQKHALDELGVDATIDLSYKTTLRKLNSMIRYFERGRMDKVAFLEAEVLAALKAYESTAMKAALLAPSKKMLLKAKELGALQYADKTYRQAVAEYRETETFIDEHVEDRASSEAKAKSTFNQAAQAFYVTLEARKILKVTAKSAEDYVLSIQEYLNQINQNAGVDALVSYSFKQQSDLLTGAMHEKNTLLEAKAIAGPDSEACAAHSEDKAATQDAEDSDENDIKEEAAVVDNQASSVEPLVTEDDNVELTEGVSADLNEKEKAETITEEVASADTEPEKVEPGTEVIDEMPMATKVIN